jgi:hypothetical protein
MESDHGVLEHVVGLGPSFHFWVASQHPSGQKPQPVADMIDDSIAGIDIPLSCEFKPLLQLFCVSKLHASIHRVLRKSAFCPA